MNCWTDNLLKHYSVNLCDNLKDLSTFIGDRSPVSGSQRGKKNVRVLFSLINESLCLVLE